MSEKPEFKSLDLQSRPDVEKNYIPDLLIIGTAFLLPKEVETLKKIDIDITTRPSNIMLPEEAKYVARLENKIRASLTGANSSMDLNQLRKKLDSIRIASGDQEAIKDKGLEIALNKGYDMIIAYHALELFDITKSMGLSKEEMNEIVFKKNGGIGDEMKSLVARLEENNISFGQIMATKGDTDKILQLRPSEVAPKHEQKQQKIAASLLYKILAENTAEIRTLNKKEAEVMKNNGYSYFEQDTELYLDQIPLAQAMEMAIKANINNVESRTVNGLGEALTHVKGGSIADFLSSLGNSMEDMMKNMPEKGEESLVDYITKQDSSLTPNEKDNILKALNILMKHEIDTEKYATILDVHRDLVLGVKEKKILDDLFGLNKSVDDDVDTQFTRSIKKIFDAEPLQGKMPNGYAAFQKGFGKATVEQTILIKSIIDEIEEKKPSSDPELKSLIGQMTLLSMLDEWGEPHEAGPKVANALLKKGFGKIEDLFKNIENFDIKTTDRTTATILYISKLHGIDDPTSTWTWIKKWVNHIDDGIESFTGVNNVAWIGIVLLMAGFSLKTINFLVRGKEFRLLQSRAMKTALEAKTESEDQKQRHAQEIDALKNQLETTTELQKNKILRDLNTELSKMADFWKNNTDLADTQVQACSTNIQSLLGDLQKIDPKSSLLNKMIGHEGGIKFEISQAAVLQSEVETALSTNTTVSRVRR